LPFPPYLQRPQLLPGRFQLNKGHVPTGDKDKSVGHAIHAGICEFGRDAAYAFDYFSQLLLDAFLTHGKPRFSGNPASYASAM